MLTIARLNNANMIAALLNLALPKQCLICKMDTHSDGNVCRSCENSLPRMRRGCRLCSLELAAHSASQVCGKCLVHAPPFDSCRVLFHYEGVIRKLVADFKYLGDFAAGEFFATELINIVRHTFSKKNPPDFLIPIPLHKSKLASRGYNQSLELAKLVSQHTGIPVLREFLIKQIPTASQSALANASDRKRNLKGSFRTSNNAITNAIESVLLIDDVVTTQSTLKEASKTLHNSGVRRVDCLCVARAD